MLKDSWKLVSIRELSLTHFKPTNGHGYTRILGGAAECFGIGWRVFQPPGKMHCDQETLHERKIRGNW